MTTFASRRAAGKLLAEEIASSHPDVVNQKDVLVLGLPRGGIPVAFEVAQKIHSPLDAFIVRKLGVPGQEELAMGALAMDGTTYLDQKLIKWLGIDPKELENTISREKDELERRATLYRRSLNLPLVHGKKVILVDDGLATGASMKAAVTALKKLAPAYLMIAIPVAPPETVKELKPLVDALLCLEEPDPFIGVGLWYRDFTQTRDEEVQTLLGTPEISEAGVLESQKSVKATRHRGKGPMPPAQETPL